MLLPTPEKNWIDRNISANHLFLAGFVLVPAFLLQDSTAIKTLQALVYVVLCRFSGRKLKPTGSILLLLGICFFHLLTPTGKVLFSIGFLPVTELALEAGLFRGLTIVGLFYLSRLCLRTGLRLPGHAGRLVSRTFFYFNMFLQGSRLNFRNPVRSLDELLLTIQRDTQTQELSGAVPTSLPGYMVLGFLVLSSWVPTLLTLSGVL